jgi:cellulose synthase/poly-beta-1,6-N-acetylglucosamine synthase-like glycosyltransferase
MAEVAFFATLLVLGYHYVGYPLTLALIARWRGARAATPGSATPTVTLIVSAYNEESVLRGKLQNVLALDYPRDRLETIVASDGSTDATVSIAREFASHGVVVHEYERNRGKNAALNDTVPRANGDVIVFTDANGMYRPDALRKLVAYFDDPSVGCVCGELIYVNYGNNAVAEGYGAYWRFDQWQKRLESRLRTLLGANGSIFAIRRSLYRPLPNTVCNDMVLPIMIAAAGHAVVYAPDAVSTEAASSDLVDELRRRPRIIARGILGVRSVWDDVIRSRRWLLAWELFWRKRIRYATPFLFLLLLASSAALEPPWNLLCAAQVALYGAAPITAVLPNGPLRRVFTPVLYFGVGTLAAALAWFKVWRGRDVSRWETAARPHERRLQSVRGNP